MATIQQLEQACSHHITDVHNYSVYKQIRWSLNIGCTPEQKAAMASLIANTYARLQELKLTANDVVDLWEEEVVPLYADITE